jgi:hypothetical protein
MQLLDIGFGDPFQPYALPDTGHGGIPHTAPLFGEYLLAVGQGSVLQVIPADQLQVGNISFQKICDIKKNVVIATPVTANGLAVYPAGKMLVCGIDVQQHPAALPIFRQGHAAAVNQIAAFREMPLHPGEPGFRAEGQGDASFIIRGGKVPAAVEIQPAAALALGTGMALPGESFAFQQGFSLGSK